VDAAPTRLVLIRHGESQATVDEVVAGHAGCAGLSALGVRQCEALGRRLARTGELAGADALLASVLPRAVETAELIAPALGMDASDVQQDCGLCELHPGEADGLTWSEFGERYGDPRMAEHPFAELSPGGESLASFHFRVGRALARVVEAREGQTIVVASHGGVVSVSLTLWLGLPAYGTLVDLPTLNTSITEWRRPPGDGRRWSLVRYNDAAHLLDPPGS
jgi:probable phosphoglycerate mutase